MNFYRGLRNTALTLATLLTVGCESDKIAGEVYDKTAFFRKGGGYNLALTIKDRKYPQPPSRRYGCPS